MNVLEEAKTIVNGDRKAQYGDYDAICTKTLSMFNTLKPDGLMARPEDLTLLMILLKLARESFKHKKDNLTDIIGYCSLLSELHNDGE